MSTAHGNPGIYSLEGWDKQVLREQTRSQNAHLLSICKLDLGLQSVLHFVHAQFVQALRSAIILRRFIAA